MNTAVDEEQCEAWDHGGERAGHGDVGLNGGHRILEHAIRHSAFEGAEASGDGGLSESVNCDHAKRPHIDPDNHQQDLQHRLGAAPRHHQHHRNDWCEEVSNCLKECHQCNAKLQPQRAVGCHLVMPLHLGIE